MNTRRRARKRCAYTGATRPMRIVLRSLLFIVALCCHDWPWGKPPWDPFSGYWESQGGARKGPRRAAHTASWGAEATTGFDGRFLGRKIATEALRQTATTRPPERSPINDDDLFEDEEPLEIWGDIDDRSMILSTTPCPCAAALRQAFNTALRVLVDRGVRNQLLLKYKLPLSFAVELQGAYPSWPKFSELYEHDLLREVLERRVLRVATISRGVAQDPAMTSFNSSFLREIVDEIDSHYSETEGVAENSNGGNGSSRRGSLPIQIEYVYKASAAVALQALDAGQAHMTDINMVLSQNPFNGITMTSRYSRSDQVMTQSTVVIVRSDANIASLRALRNAIFLSYDQEGRTVVVDSHWNHQSLSRVLPPYTVYELLSEGVPGSQLVDVLLDDEALAATAQVPLPWLHYGLRQFVGGATYALGALFLMDRHGTKCPTATSAKSGAAPAAAAAAPPHADSFTMDKPGEDPALSSLRRELTKKSVTFQKSSFYSGRRRPPMWDSSGLAGEGSLGTFDNEDSYPATPGPWSTEPSTPVGETELFDSLKVDSLDPLASGRRYLRTRALHDSYNAALVQLVHTSVLENLIEDLQEINIVPFFDCGGTVPGSVSRSFPPANRIPPDDALMDILRTGIVLVGMPVEPKAALTSPEVLYVHRATVEVVAAIGAEYRVQLQVRFIPFQSTQHVLRALHRGLIHLADARVLFDYISPHERLGFRVRPTCALGAARLWMMTQNKEGLTSLEELHETLEKLPDTSDKRVAVLEQYLRTTVFSVLPPGVVVVVLGVEEAAEALLSRSVFAVFGMATQQRRLLRSFLNLEKKMMDREERPWEKKTTADNASSTSQQQQEEGKQELLKGESPSSSPGSRSPSGPSSPEGSSSRMHADRYELASDEASGGFSWPVVAPSLQYTKDIFQELMKAEGLPVETTEAPQQTTSSWIDVDTGVTAVVHSFLAASLRPQRPAQ